MRCARELSKVSVWLCAIVVSLALAAVVDGQNPPAPRVSFEHDGQGVTGFALYAQPEKGKAIRIDVGLVLADGNGGRSVALPSLPDGSYTLSIAAYNSVGESLRVATSPERVSVKGHKIAAERTPAPETVAAPAPPAAASPATSSAKPTKPEKKGGLGRIWRAVVGEDD